MPSPTIFLFDKRRGLVLPHIVGKSEIEQVNNLPHLKYFRRKLRKTMTPAEVRLWSYLKRKQLDGRKFRRQHSVRGYILDFYCPSEKLAVELDGEPHNSAMAADYDHERSLFLRLTGIRVIRFENRVVFDMPEALLDKIREVFGEG